MDILASATAKKEQRGEIQKKIYPAFRKNSLQFKIKPEDMSAQGEHNEVPDFLINPMKKRRRKT